MDAVLTHRRSDRAVALAVAASALLWLAAFASPAAALEPPARGTVKIHEAPDHKNGSVMANDPKVCRFVIHGFGFDAGEDGDWWILQHQWGNGEDGSPVLSGSYEADANGDWSAPENTTTAHEAQHADSYGLPPGHYKLYVEARNLPTTEKHKVFKVECPPASGGNNTGGNNTGGNNTGGNNTGGNTSGGNTSGGNTSGGNTAGGSTNTGGAVLGGQGGPGTAGGARGGVLGSQGGPAAGALPNTSVPMELASSIGGLLVVLSGIGYSVNRRRSR